MEEQGYRTPKNVSSFGLESLLWNIPETVYSRYPSTLRFTFDELLTYIKGDLSNIHNYKEQLTESRLDTLNFIKKKKNLFKRHKGKKNAKNI